MADQLQDIITREDIAEVAESERLHFDEDRCEILEAMRSIDVQVQRNPLGGRRILKLGNSNS